MAPPHTRGRRRAVRRAAVALALLPLPLAGCSTGAPGAGHHDPSASASATARGGVRQPAAHAVFDYQLGGAYPPGAHVRVVSRDRTQAPAPGRYNICYVNAFQAQPGAEAEGWWRRHHPDLLLHDRDGGLVIDEDWQEPLLDVSTAGRRNALLGVVGSWIDGCARDGFDAVEPDNLDSYERSEGLLTKEDATAFATLLTRRAHRNGLAVAQKNTTDLLPRHRGIGFDFAVTEECARYGECPAYATAYDNRVFDIEYDDKDFTTACRKWGGTLSVIRRDHDVTTPGTEGYVYRTC
ncbi:hypothetical protein GCM10010211_40530 [Streptomyces albospinus]|uniref:Glycoside-hydrolase family GH114 TIM-barrel domain-containing protein n=1 Tax=Streptomyces albospinus TaxID=285515 RepID=A0ABQ2V874_9ACTN|nr:hypothetical protein GCM10010211_40530 [Streptomyces albospinus]